MVKGSSIKSFGLVRLLSGSLDGSSGHLERQAIGNKNFFDQVTFLEINKYLIDPRMDKGSTMYLFKVDGSPGIFGSLRIP